jgi:hypothetical protein
MVSRIETLGKLLYAVIVMFEKFFTVRGYEIGGEVICGIVLIHYFP